jgi:hypothetical protein
VYVYVTVVAELVFVQPGHDSAPKAAVLLTVAPFRSVYDVTGKVRVVPAQPPVTLHDSDNVNVVAAPAATDAVPGLIATLAVPAADAPSAGSATPSVTSDTLTSAARSVRVPRRPLPDRPEKTVRALPRNTSSPIHESCADS